MEIFLLGIGIILVIYSALGLKKEEKSFKSQFVQADIELDEVDVKIGHLRREFSETILELQKEIQEIKEKTYKEKNNVEVKDNEISFNSDEEKRSPIREENLIKTDIEIIDEVEETHKGEEKYEFKGAIEMEQTDGSDEKLLIDENLQIEKEIEEQKNNEKNYNNYRVEEIEELINSGHTLEEISEMLNIGKGEVLLIKELYIK